MTAACEPLTTLHGSVRANESARVAYTYLHLPIVAGIIVSAVADELLPAHPDHATDASNATTIGGPSL